MLVLFFVVALTALASGVGVILSRNPIYSALCLVVNLLIVAGLYAMLSAHFLAAVQIIVYAGAIMVLVLFVLMLLNVRLELPDRSRVRSSVFAVLGAAGFIGALSPVINQAFSGVPQGRGANGTVEAFGGAVFVEYYPLFQAAGILLMVALIGAFYLARQRQGKGVR